MEHRDYQKKSVDFLCSTNRGILKAPAGSGKTYMAASALHRCLSIRKKRASVEIMANTREQVDQMESACGMFKINEICDLKIYCAAGAPLNTNPDLIIVDECHHCTAATWLSKIMSCTGARWGLSATPFDDKNQDQIDTIKSLFTNRIYEIKREELLDEGHLSRAKVIWLNIDCGNIGDEINKLGANLIAKRESKMPWIFRSEEGRRKQVNQCKWQAAQQVGLWSNKHRDFEIIRQANEAVRSNKHVIILIGKIDHGERLVTDIDGAELCFSGMGAKKRSAVIGKFKSGITRCLIATSMLDEGFDAPIADFLILAGAGKSQRKSIQSTGRVLRPYDGKENGVIIDFKDSFNPMLSRQSAKRRAIYRDLKYLEIS